MTAYGLWPPTGPVWRLADTLAKLVWYDRAVFDRGAQLALEPHVRSALPAALPGYIDADTRVRLLRLLDDAQPSDAATVIVWWRPSDPPPGRLAIRRHWDALSPDGPQRWLEGVADQHPQTQSPSDTLPPRTRSVYVYGPGESLGAVRPPEAALTICVLTALPAYRARYGWPRIVVATDALTLTGPLRAAERRRQELAEAVVAGVRIVLERRIAAALVPYLPDGRRGLHAVPIGLSETAFGPLPDTRNVLTTLALPAALAWGDEVVLVGFDGPDARGRWRHAHARAQLSELSDIRIAFPATGLAASYYDDHLRTLQAALAAAPQASVHPASPLATTLAQLDAGTHRRPAEPPHRWRYGAAAWLDRAPCSVLTVVFLVGILSAIAAYGRGGGMATALICILLASNMTLSVGAILFLRRRQDRKAALLEDRLSARLQQHAALAAARLDTLEAAHD